MMRVTALLALFSNALANPSPPPSPPPPSPPVPIAPPPEAPPPLSPTLPPPITPPPLSPTLPPPTAPGASSSTSSSSTTTTGTSSPPPAAAAAPCFAAEVSTACRLFSPSASAAAAFDDCFAAGQGFAAERVLMTELAAGDLVLSAADEVSKVIFNQHAKVSKVAPTVTIAHSEGSLSLTADHVVFADGSFVAAREVKAGAVLSSGAVVADVSPSTHTIINPVTSSSKILAAGLEGAPVIASTHPEWVNELLMAYPVESSATNALAALFPAKVQAFYDAVMEPLNAQVAWKVGLPAPLAALVVFAIDLVCAAGFSLHSLAGVEGVAALVAVAAAAKAARK